MDKKSYELIEKYMLESMSDSAHDKEHIYRVLYVALDIANHEENVNTDVLIAACLLHDIGRKEQFENPKLCHAEIGSKKAFSFLIQNGFNEDFAHRVSCCIKAHRFRTENPPQRIEEKILFDSDKLDVTGTLGIARTIFYKGQVGEPLYTLDENENVLCGSNDLEPSFFQEYKFKLEGLYSKFYTKYGFSLAQERKAAAVSFYESMVKEVNMSYKNGKKQLNYLLR